MRLPAFAALCALALAGCAQAGTGTSGFSGEEKAVAQAVADLVDNAQRREAAAICAEDLAQDLRDRIAEPGASCAEEMDKAIDDADNFDLEVADVTIQGGRATAAVRATDRGKDVERTVRLVREAGGWRIADLG